MTWDYDMLNDHEHRIKALEAASLDAAWKAAEAALPEPGILQLNGTNTGLSKPYTVIALDQFASRPLSPLIDGSTPAEALRNLAARLAAETGGSEPK